MFTVCTYAGSINCRYRSCLKLPSSKWMDQSKSLSNEIKLCQLVDYTRPSGVDGVIVLTFIIKGDRSWTLNVHGRPVTQCSAISHFPQFVTHENVNDQLQCLGRLKVCATHPDERFYKWQRKRRALKKIKYLLVLMLLMLLSMVTHTAAHYILRHVRRWKMCKLCLTLGYT